MFKGKRKNTEIGVVRRDEKETYKQKSDPREYPIGNADTSRCRIISNLFLLANVWSDSGL